MNRKELISGVQSRVEGFNKNDIGIVLDNVLNEITQSLALGEDVNILNFGKFSVVETAERQARNPKSGESILVPKGKKAKFKPSKILKDIINS